MSESLDNLFRDLPKEFEEGTLRSVTYEIDASNEENSEKYIEDVKKELASRGYDVEDVRNGNGNDESIYHIRIRRKD